VFALAPDKISALGINLLVDTTTALLGGLRTVGAAVVNSPRAVAGTIASYGDALGITRNRPVEASLVSFVHFALQKLEAAAGTFEDGTPEEDYQDLCTFADGMSRNLKAAGAGAGPQLRGAIRDGLLPVWDIGSDVPGPSLKAGGAAALKDALLVRGVLSILRPLVLAAGGWRLAAGCWTAGWLAAGCSLLAAHCWLLAAGC
jgi:hypothetical protein